MSANDFEFSPGIRASIEGQFAKFAYDLLDNLAEAMVRTAETLVTESAGNPTHTARANGYLDACSFVLTVRDKLG